MSYISCKRARTEFNVPVKAAQTFTGTLATTHKSGSTRHKVRREDIAQYNNEKSWVNPEFVSCTELALKFRAVSDLQLHLSLTGNYNSFLPYLPFIGMFGPHLFFNFHKILSFDMNFIIQWR
jgi:hypothetical protein